MADSSTAQHDAVGAIPAASSGTHFNRAFVVAVTAGVIAFFAALSAPYSAFSGAWQIGLGIPHAGLATGLCAPFPLLGLAGLLIPRGPRYLRQLLVCLGGLGTGAVAVVCVLLSGPHQTAFVRVPDEASPGGIAGYAIVASAAALTMIVADAISWRRAAGRQTP
ncbi:MAG: hypothetical protein ABR941_00820 [Thermoleophilia bacterium]|jgi:hypothetical protein